MNSRQNNIYYDGECNLCKRSINFVGGNDKQGKFLFTPFQPTKNVGEQGTEVLHTHIPHTVIFETKGKKYEKSTAVLMILRELGFPWNLLYFFIIIPRPIRDFVYDFVARNRKRQIPS